MKSCQCAQCNVSSARFTWGFTLLTRDGWSVSPGSELVGSADGAWLCPTCRRRSETSAQSAAHLSSKRRGRARSRAQLRVLLIDDEEVVRRCTARLLSDFEVVSAHGAEEALKVLEIDSDFDAILSDVMMPGMTGPALYAACYVRFPHLARRFVFASGNPEAARVQVADAVASVAAEHPPVLLAKPQSREGLMLALFVAAAEGLPRSGTYFALDAADADFGVAEVSKYRG
jgi:CheY-like chemotaxis protein